MQYSRRGMRGAVIVETALSLSLLLMLLFGSFQVALVSYYQITLDAAMQAHTRALALGVSSTTVHNSIDAPYSSLLGSSTITDGGAPQALPAPISGVMYGGAGTGSRSGGITMLLPQQLTSTASVSGGLATISTTVIESAMRDVCPHFCMVDGGFGTSAAQGSGVNYFGSVDDNSPYFGSFGFMKTCYSSDTNSLSATNDMTVAHQWDTCDASNVLWRGFSPSAQLTSQNYEFELPGMSQGATAADPSGTFYSVWCHRRFYAYIATQLAAWPSMPASTTDVNTFLTTLFHGYDASGTIAPGDLIYGIGSTTDAAMTPPGWDATDLMTAPSTSANPFEDNEDEYWGCDIY
jgi:hypothetical protein